MTLRGWLLKMQLCCQRNKLLFKMNTNVISNLNCHSFLSLIENKCRLAELTFELFELMLQCMRIYIQYMHSLIYLLLVYIQSYTFTLYYLLIIHINLRGKILPLSAFLGSLRSNNWQTVP